MASLQRKNNKFMMLHVIGIVRLQTIDTLCNQYPEHIFRQQIAFKNFIYLSVKFQQGKLKVYVLT